MFVKKWFNKNLELFDLRANSMRVEDVGILDFKLGYYICSLLRLLLLVWIVWCGNCASRYSSGWFPCDSQQPLIVGVVCNWPRFRKGLLLSARSLRSITHLDAAFIEILDWSGWSCARGYILVAVIPSMVGWTPLLQGGIAGRLMPIFLLWPPPIDWSGYELGRFLWTWVFTSGRHIDKRNVYF